jgi:DNA-binding transcriptional LysR family regulator
MKDINATSIFAAVVDAGSFSAAAEKLGVTKSAVSKRVTGLETRLGVKLLSRTTRKLSLTEAGQRYFVHVQEALRAIDDAEFAATELQNVPQGTLRISTPMSFGRLHVAPVIPRFLEKYPQIKVHLDMNDVSHDLVAEGYDIALKTGELNETSLIARKLAPLRSVLCASPDYVEQHGAPKTPEDLLSHNCLLYSYHTTINEWVFDKNGDETRIQVAGSYQVNNSEALLEAILQGSGIARVPTFVAGPDIKAGRLVSVLRDYSMPTKDIYAVFPERKYLPMKVRVFIDFIVDNFGGSDPCWDAY